MNPDGILIHRIFFPVSVLGPGGDRVGIWTQGCTLRCPRCMTPESHEFDREKKILFSDIKDRLQKYYNQGIKSVVISGGEPFDQSEELHILLKLLREIGFLDILSYTGYSFQYICTHFPKIYTLIDILITEPFIFEETNTKNWRGSDNQEIHVISENADYQVFDLNQAIFPDVRSIQIEHEDSQIFIIGIPRRKDLDTLISKCE